MKRPLIYITSLLLLELGLSLLNQCLAQDDKELSPRNPIEQKDISILENTESDSLTVPTLNLEIKEIKIPGIDTEEVSEGEKKDVIVVPPSNSFVQAIELSLDYLKLLSTFIPNENRAEAGLSILFKKNIMLSLEGGYGELQPQKAFKNSNYSSTGIYGRLGLDYVINFDAKNNMILGVRYAQSHFEDQAEWRIANDLWGGMEESFHREGLVAHWAELIFASEAKFKTNFYYGFMFRLRRLMKVDHLEPIPVYSIPGYGRTMDRTLPAFNLFIKYKIPF